MPIDVADEESGDETCPQRKAAAGRRLRVSPAWLGPAALSLAGCAGQASPSLPLFGAYFPSWLICAVAGVLGAVATRLLFVRLGIDDGLPWRLLVYACLAAGIGFVVALTVYGR